MQSFGLIDWGNIQLSFTASARLPPSYLTERLLKLEELWREAADQDVAKLALNSLFGTWAKIHKYRYALFTTSDLEDVLFSGQRRVRQTPGGKGLSGRVCGD